MKIGLIEGKVAHQRDDDIVKALKAAKTKLGGSSDTVIAFKNEAGEVYRYAVLNGMYQEMYLDQRLEPLGIFNRTEQGERKPKGVWAVFGPSRDMSVEAMIAEARRIQSRKGSL
jgi:hypothetical protein